jgi:hypothetical protein
MKEKNSDKLGELLEGEEWELKLMARHIMKRRDPCIVYCMEKKIRKIDRLKKEYLGTVAIGDVGLFVECQR